MNNFLTKKRWLVYVLLGLTNALPFTFESLFFVSWFSLAPVFISLIQDKDNGVSEKKLFLYSFLFFFAFHFGIYHFFIALIPMSFIGLGYISSVFLTFFAWVILSLFHAITLSLAFFFILKLDLFSSVKIIALSLSFVLVQYLQGLGVYGFTWARISLPQSALLPLIQSSSLLGPYFVDLLLLLVNAFIAISFFTKKVSLWGGLAIAVFSLNFLYGFIYMQKDFRIDSKRNVSIIQGNVLADEKWAGASSYSTYLTQSLLLQNTDSLVIWPETAIPTDLNDSKKIKNELETYTVSSGNDMLVGAFYSSSVGREMNAAYYISSGELSNQIYFKRRLVPFGEFLPFRSLLQHIPVLDSINVLANDLYCGYGENLIDTRDGRVGALICFDSIFQNLARSSTAKGAELLVVITNDSWYKDFPAVYQHNNQAKWRAVENGRYVVRAANSGISSVITPNGEIISYLPPLVMGHLTEEVGFISENTLYTLVGDIVIIPIALFLLLILTIGIKTVEDYRKKGVVKK